MQPIFLFLILALLHQKFSSSEKTSISVGEEEEICVACQYPPVSRVPFCGAPMYPVCVTAESFRQRDFKVQQQWLEAKNHSKGFSSHCYDSIKKVLCASEFHACELQQPLSFCVPECTKMISENCENRISSTQLCQQKAADSDEDECFGLSYSGPPTGQWMTGVSIAVVFSFFSSIGINLQKRAIKSNEALGARRKPVYRLPLWIFGFILILLGSILDLVAFGFAPQSLLAPLGALTLVWNMMLAPCFNNELLDRRDIAATTVIFTGATLAVMFGNKGTPEYSLDDLLGLYRAPITITYFAIVAVLIGGHYLTIRVTERILMNQDRTVNHVIWTRFHMIAYAGFAGLMGGQSVLFAKSCAELAKALLRGDKVLESYETYIIVAALLLCLLSQIHFLNGGLSHYDALSVVPTYQAYWILTGVSGGVIYFQEIRYYTTEQSVMFAVGILTTICGVSLLAQRRSVPKDVVSDKNISTFDAAELHSSGEDVDEVNRHVINDFLDASPRVSVGDILYDMGIRSVETSDSGLFPRRRSRNYPVEPLAAVNNPTGALSEQEEVSL